jgi:uncharacterized peroxidase-related enzyme
MSFFQEFGNDRHLAEVMKNFPTGQEELLIFHDVVLRGQSPLTIGEREMIACYVSRLNGCRFCSNSHRVFAAFYGVDPEIFDKLDQSIGDSGIGEKLVPIFRYARKVTLDHDNIEKSDIEAILTAGWDDQAVFDTASVAALFNYMNRLVHSMGVSAHDEEYDKRLNAVLKMPLEARLAHNEKDLGGKTYTDFGRAMKIF